MENVLNATKDVHVIRDATRGGVGTVLYEIARESSVGIEISYEDVPIANEVKGVTGLLGLEPLYLACEGRMVIIVPKEKEKVVLEALKNSPYTEGAKTIGKITNDHVGRVVMTTSIGAQTILPKPGNELLPRIC